MATQRSVKKGQTIVYQGEVPYSVFEVKSGLVRALSINENGEERTLALYGPGDFFPLGYAHNIINMALFSYVSQIQTELALHPKDEFMKLVASDNEATAKQLATQYVASMVHINALGQATARDKIIHILHYLSIRFGEELTGKVFTRITVPLTQLDIAKMASVTRETAAVELGTLRKEGLVDVKKRYYSVFVRGMLDKLSSVELNNLSL